MNLPHDEGWNIPWDAPLYPPLPAVYRNVKSHLLFFTAPPEAIARFLPAPLKPAPDGLCMAGGLDIPFCTNYGSFLEAYLQLKCVFGEQEGYFCSHVFHNGPTGIAAGREIYGTPKFYSELSVRYPERAMVTEARLTGTGVLQLNTLTTSIVAADSLPSCAPSWRLKVIPRADRPGPAVKQLIDGSRAVRDYVVHFCARAKGTLSLAASPSLDLTPLQPVTYGDAYYIESSFSETYAEIVYDYLNDGRPTERKNAKTA